MNTFNCTDRNTRLIGHTLLSAIYIFVFVVGLVLNVWGMKSLLHNWKKLSGWNIFVLNLGLADILYLLTHPFLIVHYLKGNNWIFGESFCKVTRFSFKLNLYCSIGFLTCISVYRYLSIVHPMRVMGRLTTTRSVVTTVLVWILVSAQSLPDLTFPKTSGNKTEKCFDTTDRYHAKEYLTYSLCLTFFGLCIPFAIIVGCYGHVTLVICRSNTMVKNQKRQIFKLLTFLILLFSLCFAPYHVFKNLNLYSKVLLGNNICPTWDSGVFMAYQVSRGLVGLNSALNPLVYLHVNEDMGVQFRQLLQRCHQMFCRWSKPESSSVLVPQTEQETVNAL